MDLNLTPEEKEFRDELRAWLVPNVPRLWEGKSESEEESRAYFDYLRDWQKKVFEAGWAGISWPREFGGRGASVIQQAIFQEEWARASAPMLVNGLGLALIGPTIIHHGTEEQKKRFLPRILSADEIWCQGFSEPNAGSDVAALGTKAILDGDDFIINGQKIWTSLAHFSDWILLLVRTDPGAAKHKGITALLVDMHSEGVSVRPLRQMTGESGFNEVFFTNVRVPVANVLGKVNEGWTTAITTLMNERANLGSAIYVAYKRNFEALIARAKQVTRFSRPATEDPVIRQKLAQAYLELEIFKLNTNRALSKLAKTHVPGPEGSISKIYWSEFNQRFQQIAMETLGPWGQLTSLDDNRWVYGYLRTRGNTIEAGTSEIQRNILAERVLGLPKSY
jgi:alkylation response protein AidB-like acyl-CoA dehydrogenase